MTSRPALPGPSVWRVIPLDDPSATPDPALDGIDPAGGARPAGGIDNSDGTGVTPEPAPMGTHTRGDGVDSSSATSADDRYKWRLLAVIALAVAGFGSLMTLVTAALSPIAEDFDSTVSTATWLLTGLMLAMAVATPMGGKLGDTYGHRRLFLLGLGSMTAIMLVSALTPSLEVLIGLRVLFGLAGALVMPCGMALLMGAFGPEDRARALGWYQFAMTGAPTVGVIIGGPLMDIFGWRGVFVVFGVVGLIAFAAALIVVRPEDHQRGSARIDLLGGLLLGTPTLLVLLAITRMSALVDAGRPLLTDPIIVAEILGAAALYVAFVLWELRVESPMLDVRLFRKPTFSMPLVASCCNQFAYMGAFVLVPAILQGPYGYSVGVSAVLMMPRPGVFALASPLGGSLVGRIGWRIPMAIGTFSMVGSMAAFAAGSEAGGLAFVIVGLVLSGLSAGIASPGYQALVANSVSDEDLGVANGMSQMMTWIGIILGIQSMVAIAGQDPSATRLMWTFAFGGVVAAIGLLAPLTAPKRRTR